MRRRPRAQHLCRRRWRSLTNPYVSWKRYSRSCLDTGAVPRGTNVTRILKTLAGPPDSRCQQQMPTQIREMVAAITHQIGSIQASPIINPRIAARASPSTAPPITDSRSSSPAKDSRGGAPSNRRATCSSSRTGSSSRSIRSNSPVTASYSRGRSRYCALSMTVWRTCCSQRCCHITHAGGRSQHRSPNL